MKNIIWRPLGRNKTLGCNWELLIELASKYNKTQSQIILNWICHLGYAPMVLSLEQKHIDENIDSMNFAMSDADYQKMNDFRPPHYTPPPVRWDSPSTDDDIVALVNGFDNHINNQL